MPCRSAWNSASNGWGNFSGSGVSHYHLIWMISYYPSHSRRFIKRVHSSIEIASNSPKEQGSTHLWVNLHSQLIKCKNDQHSNERNHGFLNSCTRLNGHVLEDVRVPHLLNVPWWCVSHLSIVIRSIKPKADAKASWVRTRNGSNSISRLQRAEVGSISLKILWRWIRIGSFPKTISQTNGWIFDGFQVSKPISRADSVQCNWINLFI